MTETTETSGKWILSGEHAVIHNRHAIAFPLPDKKMRLTWTAREESSFVSQNPPELAGIIEETLIHGADLANIPIPKYWGSFQISSNIDIGYGLGSSAAICVLAARWFINRGYISQAKLLPFATLLENNFHSNSSGLDIAVVVTERPILFSRPAGIKALNLTWRPKLYLSSSGIVGKTSDAVKQVQNANSKILYDRMESATTICLKTLTEDFSDQSLGRLAQGIDTARECFKDWGLITKPLQQSMDSLTSAGAIAVKPTGAGGGGFILSLWNRNPPLSLKQSFILAL
jgi:mevalonate kinase